MRKMREQKGYITIEATIVLSIYIFAFMMIFSLIHICRAQMKISVAINNAAKEISEYSYLYGVSGLSDSMYNAGQSAAQTQQDYSELPEDVGTLYSEISSLGDKQGNMAGAQGISPDNIKNIYGKLDSIKQQGGGVESTISDMASNPKELMMGVTKVLAYNASEELKYAIASALTKALVKQNLKSSLSDGDKEINSYLHNLGVKKNQGTYLESIDFSHSELFPAGNNEIKIIAVYEVEALPLLNIDASFRIVQTARTRGWLKGDEDPQITTKDTEDDVKAEGQEEEN